MPQIVSNLPWLVIWVVVFLVQSYFFRKKNSFGSLILLWLTLLVGIFWDQALRALVPGIPETSIICPPFHCDHGDGIKLGEHVFVNANCTFLDGGYITIGAHTLVGPCVQIYTPHHPMDYQERRGSKEYAYPVTIGEDCWIGGGAIICPGVTIGNRCVIGAGSVVTKDIPDDSVAVGNPARVIRK